MSDSIYSEALAPFSQEFIDQFYLEVDAPTWEELQEELMSYSEANSGPNNPMFGWSHSGETKKQISKKLKGYKWSKERNKKISDSHKGIPLSNEHKEKIKHALNNPEIKEKYSKSTLGTKFWNNGRENKRSKTCPGEGWALGRVKTW